MRTAGNRFKSRARCHSRSVCGRWTTRRCRRAAGDVHDDVDTAPSPKDRGDDGVATIRRCDVRGDEPLRREFARTRSRGRQNVRARFERSRNDSLADAPRAASDQSSTALKFEWAWHQRMARLAILPSTRSKLYVSSMGLPGKFAATRARTVAVAPSREALRGSTRYW